MDDETRALTPPLRPHPENKPGSLPSVAREAAHVTLERAATPGRADS